MHLYDFAHHLGVKLWFFDVCCGGKRFTYLITSLANSFVYILLKQTYLEKKGLHHFPAVGSKKQVHCVVCQLAFVLQVGADQLPNCSGPVCPKELERPL